MVSGYLVLLFYGIVKVAFGAVGYVYSVWQYYRTKKLYSFAVMLQVNLFWVQDQL